MINISRVGIDKIFKLWFVVVSFTGFSSLLSPFFSWGLTLCLIVLLMFFLYKNIKKIDFKFSENIFSGCFFAIFSLFIAHIFVAGLVHEQYIKAFVYTAKFTIILFLMVFLYFYKLSKENIISATFLAFYINLLVLILSLVLGGKSELIVVLGDGRIGTVFNPVGVGSLWLLACCVFFMSIVFYANQNHHKFLVSAFIAALMVFLDGSRTGQLLIFSAFFLIFSAKNKINLKFGMRELLVIICIIILASVLAEFIRQLVTAKNYDAILTIHRLFGLAQLFDAHTNTNVSIHVNTNDVTRLEMMKFGLYKTLECPWNIIGGGIESAKIKTSSGLVVVHMTYFQVWLDYGVGAFIAYVALIFTLIFYILYILKNKIIAKSDSLLFVSLYVLLGYGFISLVQPLSNEVSNWLFFIVFSAYALQQKVECQ